MKEKVLVTGGAGFVGSHVVDCLIQDGHEVVVLDDLSGGFIENVNPKALFVKGTINDKELVNKLVKDSTIVYHLAAYAAEGLSHFIRKFNYENNLIGSINLINASIKYDVKKFLFTSSMAVYGTGKPPFDESMAPDPEDPYGISKFAVELDLRSASDMFGLKYVVIRPHNIYGERQNISDPYRNVIGIFMNRILHGKPPLIYGDGKQTRAFSYISDVAPCIAKAPFIKSAENQIINLGSGKMYSLNELAKMVSEAMSSPISAVHAPPRYEVKHAYCTTEKSERILGFKENVPLSEGTKRIAEWIKKKGPTDPVLWDSYELEKNLPEFWKNLNAEFVRSGLRKAQ